MGTTVFDRELLTLDYEGFGVSSLVDIDADGDMDVLVGADAGDTWLLENVGDAIVARFAAPSATSTRWRSPAA